MKEQLVICGSLLEFEQYCMQEGRDRSNTHQISQPFQLAMYPNAEIVFYGEYGKNACYGSKELKDFEDRQAQKELEDMLKP